MGMGYSGAFDIVVEMNHLQKLHPESFGNFIAELDNSGVDLTEYAESLMYDDNLHSVSKEEQDRIDEAYRAFCKDFKETHGMSIHLGYHSSEDVGSRYDEVDGPYFHLDFHDVYEYKPEAKKFLEKADFERRHFVVFG